MGRPRPVFAYWENEKVDVGNWHGGYVMKRALLAFFGLLSLLVVGLAPAPVEAQRERWSIFRNCNTRPCTIGVAVSTWMRPGWSRIQTFSNVRGAWRRACWLHLNNSNYNSPDVVAGRVNCSQFR